jgi:hypothetical protein
MMSSYDRFTWRETTPGVWQRGVDEVEHFYFALAKSFEGSGRMFFAITGHLSLHVDIPESDSREQVDTRLDEALRKAWLTLRFYQPTIASHVAQDAGMREPVKVYRTIQREADRRVWLESSLVPVSTGQTGIEWANADPVAPNMPTLFIINPHLVNSRHNQVIRRDLVLRSPHEIIDGIGTLQLLSNFIGHVSKAYAEGDRYRPPVLDGSETSRLSPPFRVAASVPVTLNETQQKRLAEMALQKGAARQSDGDVAVLGVPFKHGAVLPGKHQRVAHTVCEEQTSRLLAACKALDATVTHAFHAAIAMVIRDVQEQKPEASRIRYVNYILRNERASCIEPYNTSEHAAAVYHSVSGKALVIDMDALAIGEAQNSSRSVEYAQIIQSVKGFYEDVRNDPEHYALAPAIWAREIPNVPLSAAAPLPVPPPKSLPSVSISSMGRVDSIITPDQGAVHVYNPWVTGEELGNGLGLFLGTYRGKLCLSGAYNDAWHTRDEVLDFLQRCVDVVFDGLSVSTV